MASSNIGTSGSNVSQPGSAGPTLLQTDAESVRVSGSELIPSDTLSPNTSRRYVESTNSNSPVRLPRDEFDNLMRVTVETLTAWSQTSQVRNLGAALSTPTELTSLETIEQIVLTPKGLKTLSGFANTEIAPIDSWCAPIKSGKRLAHLLLNGLLLEDIRSRLIQLAQFHDIDCSSEDLPVPAPASPPLATNKVATIHQPEALSLSGDLSQKQLRSFLDRHQTVYCKPGLLQGIGIFRISKGPDGGYTFESNCTLIHQGLRQFRRGITPFLTDLRHTFQLHARLIPRLWHLSSRRDTRPLTYIKVKVPNFERASYIIANLCAFSKNPYRMEAGIPMESANHKRYEFRIIVLPSGRRSLGGSTELAIKAHYAKCSHADMVVGNIATGGYGVTSDYALELLLRKRLPEISPAALKSTIKREKNRMLDVTENYIEASGAKGAIDIAPVWNEREQQFDWHLIEHGIGIIGIHGLRADPYLYEQFCRDAIICPR